MKYQPFTLKVRILNLPAKLDFYENTQVLSQNLWINMERILQKNKHTINFLEKFKTFV
jgi:hypothetical protein